MIELLPRLSAMEMTIEDLEIIWSRGSTQSSVEIAIMRAGDRRDAEMMFARTDAAADTGVSAVAANIIRNR